MNEELENVDWTNSIEIIAFYEKNSIYFSNYDFITNQDKICQFTSVKLNYSFALIEISDKINKVYSIYNEISYLLKKVDENNIHYLNLIERKIYLKSILYSYKSKYCISNILLSQLITKYPRNTDYRKWKRYNRNKILSNLFLYSGVCSLLIILFCSIFLDNNVFKSVSLILILILGLIYIVKNLELEDW